jgi:isopentenyl phosphate kinase
LKAWFLTENIYYERPHAQPPSMILIKLGGSVITHKEKYRSLNLKALERLASEIASAGKQVILVHGAGSFGHVVAHEFQLDQGFRDKGQLQGVAKVQMDVRDLNLMVMRSLEVVDLPAASIPPSACALLEEGKLKKLDTELFHRYLDLGMVPVTFGEVVLDRVKGFGICSGDQLIYRLAREFHPERIIFCADVDGIFTSDPNLDDGAELIEKVDRQVLGSLPRTTRHKDVTGSIYGKIECMLRMASSAGSTMVINGLVEGRLEGAIKGESVVGSRVVGG